MQDVKEKVAFITGGASGIGRGMARAFADAGMKIMIADIEEAALDEAVADMRTRGAEAEGVVCDVTDRNAVFAAADRTVDQFGKVHLVCLNAGVGVTGATEKVDQKNWEWVIDVNLWGVIYGLQAFVPILKSQGEGGHIVTTASMAGMASFAQMGPYNATKFAVVTLSETLWAEVHNEGIGVSVLCPGVVSTNIFDSTRNRQSKYGGPGRAVNPGDLAEQIKSGLSADVVGEQVLEAVRDDQLYIFTDPTMRRFIETRCEKIMAGYDWADNCAALRKAGVTEQGR